MTLSELIIEVLNLEASKSALEGAFGRIEGWLIAATAAVIVGLAIEYLPEIFHAVTGKDFKWKRASLLFGALLVIGGIVWEVVEEVSASSVESQVEDINTREVTLLLGEAKDADSKIVNDNKTEDKFRAQLRIDESTEKQLSDAMRQQQGALTDATQAIRELRGDLAVIEKRNTGVGVAGSPSASGTGAVSGVREKIRSLLSAVDPRVVFDIDGGATDLTVRMEPQAVNELKQFIQQPGGAALVSITGYGKRCINCVLMDGTLGPIGAVADQQQVMLHIGTGLRGP